MKPFGLFLLLVALGAPAMADIRAVLVGVGDYLHIDADLEGPPNDVRLMAQSLVKRGVALQDMTALTDPLAHLPEGLSRGVPDRAAILAALTDAIDASQRDDTVLFYFSGHGSQAPDMDGDEGGGFDEIFLPRDVRGWNGTSGLVENAIVDDEFAVLTRRAAERGVTLVAIMDACHSGTGFRAVESRAVSRARYVDPAMLNLPDGVDDPPVQEAAAPPGDYVFLYAAQSDQRAFEYPVGEGADRRWHGDFTRSLTSVMDEFPDLTYAQLVAAASQRMQMQGGKPAQTPDVEGPLADSPVFGGGAPGFSRTEIIDGRIQAGLLQNLTEGSEVALYSGLMASEPVGRAIAEDIGAATARLRILDPAPEVRVTHASIIRRAPDVSFSAGFDAGAASRLDSLEPGGLQDLAARLDFPLIAPDADADHRIVWTGEAFALVGRDGVLDAAGPGSSPRLAFPATSATLVQDLADSLTRLAARKRLDRALATLGQGSGGVSGFSLFPSGPQVSFAVTGGGQSGGRCRPVGAPTPVSDRVTAAHCAVVSVEIENPTLKMQDVTVLYIDRASAISVLWPGSGLSNRIESGGKKRLRFGLRHDGPAESIAAESLLVLSVPAEPGDMRTVFAGLGSADGQARGAAAPMAAFLGQLTDPSATSRNFARPAGQPELSVSRLEILLRPR